MPFAGYKNWEDCIKFNKNKRNPQAYCGKIESNIRKHIEGNKMSKAIKKWISPNKLWEIQLHKDYDRMTIENKKTGYIDFPITYAHSGRTAYDDPYVIPQYVKDQYHRMIK